MIAAIHRTLFGRTLAALAALAIVVGAWHAAAAHSGVHALGGVAAAVIDDHAHDHGHDHGDPGPHASALADEDRAHAAHDRIDHDHPQSLASARRQLAAPPGETRVAWAHASGLPDRTDNPFRPPRS